MDKHKDEELKSTDTDTKTNIAIDAMDLVNITFRSLELREARPQESNFFDLEKQNVAIERDEAEKQSRRARHSLGEIKSSSKEETKKLKTINLDEVSWHDTADNCWVVIHDFVYDVTDFVESHPGGSDVILEYAGRDATLPFIGTGHSSMARAGLDRYLIGELPREERIFRVSNGIRISEF
ncbi:cytochrome B5-like protein [Ceratina calcarata]|uniref:Cytochrome B5-like protein n=1 Tax=Ceratina calcarata TaxID=156304 RepID=A0AAJ7W9X4_9HYME|nr:cytochrome B5-like protein [Ceratina calcarata]